MPFEKGKKKTGGRKKGVVNTDKRLIRDAINSLLDDIPLKKLYEEQATPKDKANLLIGLLEFSIPKLNRTELKDETIREIIVKLPEPDEE